MTDPYLRDIVAGIATLLGQGHLGVGVYSPGAVIPSDAVAIGTGEFPGAFDRAIAVTYYTDDRRPDLALARTFVQVRVRHPDYLGGLDLKGGVGKLHRMTHVRLGQVEIGEIRQVSSGTLPDDSAGRKQWSTNFQLTGLRPFGV